ncbi:HD domain-containing protein [Spirosoma aerophilum]
MDLTKKNLEDWLAKPPTNLKTLKKGDTTPFYSKYNSFKSYIETTHGEVERGSLLTEIEQAIAAGKQIDLNLITLLNDHGPKHIATVIERASQILNVKIIDLNVREVFILLNAIQLHDVGNFYGRIGHEQKIKDVFRDGLPLVAFDSVEHTYIKNVAQVHGGSVLTANGHEDKNTIRTIKESVTSDGYEIRQRLLAAILRFSDEIADDKHRAAVNLLNAGKIPKGSEVFHAYSACLDTVLVKHNIKTVEFHFKIPKNYATKKFGKINRKKDTIEDVYLVDEIYKRAVKTHEEKIYCSKFWKKFLDIEKIWIQIEFYHPNEIGEFVHHDITFTLEDNDYPQQSNLDIYTLCPDLIINGIQLCGSEVEKHIKELTDGKD